MTQKQITQLNKVAEKVTNWIGSLSSLLAHTLIFVAALIFILFWENPDTIMLVLTTAVSLEAIYLAIFIQITINRHTESLEEIEEDIDEIEKDVDEIQEDVDEIIEDDKAIDQKRNETKTSLEKIHSKLEDLTKEIEKIKTNY